MYSNQYEKLKYKILEPITEAVAVESEDNTEIPAESIIETEQEISQTTLRVADDLQQASDDTTEEAVSSERVIDDIVQIIDVDQVVLEANEATEKVNLFILLLRDNTFSISIKGKVSKGAITILFSKVN